MFSNRPRAALVAELTTLRGSKPRVLAHGGGPEAEVVVLVDVLAIRRSGEWCLIEWHLVQAGGWKGETGRLEWTLADQSKDHVVLDQPGRVPESFRERVNASIIVQQAFDVPSGGRVMIAGRRSLAPGKPDEPPVWQAVTQGRAKLSDPEVRQFVLEATQRLRADFGF